MIKNTVPPIRGDTVFSAFYQCRAPTVLRSPLVRSAGNPVFVAVRVIFAVGLVFI